MPPRSDNLAAFEPLLTDRPLTVPWRGGAERHYECDGELLIALLSLPLSTTVSQASGRVAKAVDAWAAHELRRAGFDADEVWPRATQPRVLTPELRLLLDHLGDDTRNDIESLMLRRPALRPAEAKVLGRVFTKQADVLIASWERGPELLISTKTMLSSYGKNLRNRFEEAYGDAKNLRGRFPLLALGFLFLVRDNMTEAERRFAEDMLRKLTDEYDGYDFASLIVVGWEGPTMPEGDDEEREDEADEDEDGGAHAAPTHEPHVRLRRDLMASDLTPEAFFSGLVEAVLSRTPVDHHLGVREAYEGRPLPLEEGESS